MKLMNLVNQSYWEKTVRIIHKITKNIVPTMQEIASVKNVEKKFENMPTKNDVMARVGTEKQIKHTKYFFIESEGQTFFCIIFMFSIAEKVKQIPIE